MHSPEKFPRFEKGNTPIPFYHLVYVIEAREIIIAQNPKLPASFSLASSGFIQRIWLILNICPLTVLLPVFITLESEDGHKCCGIVKH
jgi:hypothetical protein